MVKKLSNCTGRSKGKEEKKVSGRSKRCCLGSRERRRIGSGNGGRCAGKEKERGMALEGDWEPDGGVIPVHI